jgi:hypothetical protein
MVSTFYKKATLIIAVIGKKYHQNGLNLLIFADNGMCNPSYEVSFS